MGALSIGVRDRSLTLVEKLRPGQAGAAAACQIVPVRGSKK
jgi:hypothetical protein